MPAIPFAVKKLLLIGLLVAGFCQAATETGPAALPMTAMELDAFVVTYYTRPQPELIATAIAALEPSGFAEDRAEVFVGFFAEVFAANPVRMDEWRKVIDRQKGPAREVLRQALKTGEPDALLAGEFASIEFNDRCWGAFFASGNAAYLRKLAEQLPLIDKGDSRQFWAGATALWSLARNAPVHPLVRLTLAEVMADSDARTRNLIEEVLSQDPEAIRRKIQMMQPDPQRPRPNGAMAHSTTPNSFEATPRVIPSR